MAYSYLHFETVTDLLKETLYRLMKVQLFDQFSLVGGTNLSLRFGHRKSEDIDLFTDAEYGSINFNLLEDWLSNEFPYFDKPDKSPIVGMGRCYYIGDSEIRCVKLDLMYTDPFMSKPELIDGIRMASVPDIIAMKLNVILLGGRKKDFWDIHYLLDSFSLSDMLTFHKIRHEWEYERESLLKGLINFSGADKDFNPKCLLLKNWDDIKLDFIDEVEKLLKNK